MSHNGTQQRRFADPVAPENGADFAGLEAEREVIEDGRRAVAGADAFEGEERAHDAAASPR